MKPSEREPKKGGKLVFAVEAETDGWNPTTNRWANSGTQVALSIFDPLAALDKDLQPKPYLAEALTPNANFTEWVIKLRPNIKFHNGQALNAAALVKSVTALKASPLTGAAAKPIQKVDPVDDRQAIFEQVQIRLGQPAHDLAAHVFQRPARVAHKRHTMHHDTLIGRVTRRP